MRKLLSLLLSTALLGGCAAGPVQRLVSGIVVKDLTRAEEMANKYGKPDIASCAKHLREAVGGREALLAEDSDGLLSLALKFYLLKEGAAGSEQEFKKQCGPFAVGLLLEIGKNARGF